MPTRMNDIQLDTSYDLLLANGDFLQAECTAQNQQVLLVSNKGDFKQNPTICVGAVNYFDDEQFSEVIRAISVEFSRDGMDVKGVSLSAAGVITTDAYYQ